MKYRFDRTRTQQRLPGVFVGMCFYLNTYNSYRRVFTDTIKGINVNNISVYEILYCGSCVLHKVRFACVNLLNNEFKRCCLTRVQCCGCKILINCFS